MVWGAGWIDYSTGIIVVYIILSISKRFRSSELEFFKDFSTFFFFSPLITNTISHNLLFLLLVMNFTYHSLEG